MNKIIKVNLRCLFAYVMIMTSAFPAYSGKLAKFISKDIEQQWEDYWNNEQGYLQREFSKTYPYEDCFREAANKQNLPVSLLLAVARAESGFNERAVSRANAVGVMQILWPTTAQDLGFKNRRDLFDPCPNIHAGARYIRRKLRDFEGNLHLAIAAYNYGTRNINEQLAAKRGISQGAKGYSSYVFYHLEKVKGTYADRPRLRLASSAVPKRPAPVNRTQGIVLASFQDDPESSQRDNEKRDKEPHIYGSNTKISWDSPIPTEEEFQDWIHFRDGGESTGQQAEVEGNCQGLACYEPSFSSEDASEDAEGNGEKEQVKTVHKAILLSSDDEAHVFTFKRALEDEIEGIVLHAYTDSTGVTSLVLELDDEDNDRQERILNALVSYGLLRKNKF